VLEVNGDNAVVQLFEPSAGIKLPSPRSVSWDTRWSWRVGRYAGRVFNGMGHPIDAAPRFWPPSTGDINGLPMNPAARDYPNEFISQSISTIDGLNTWCAVRSALFLRFRTAHANLAARSPVRPGARRRHKLRRRIRRHRITSRAEFFIQTFAAPEPSTVPFCSPTWPTTPPSSVSPLRVWR
jgi:vacuolar-type H+-ATPase subunit B/Vma2